ncbi:MAG: hypothetical protein GXO02_00430 [Epsilonproteobacteria bacterium]|nr:hypothetical protein [Campylobacterota bacterium]
MENFLYYLFIFFIFLVKKSPQFLREYLKRGVAFLLYILPTKRKKIVQKNIEILNGKYDKEIEKRFYYNFVDNLFDMVDNFDISKEELAKRVEFKNKEMVDKVLKESKNAIFITAHYGNWELTPTIMAAFVTPIDAVVRKLTLKRFNDLIERSRTRFGVTLYDRREGVKNLIKTLKSKKSLGILVDQYPGDNKGVEVSFFGQNIRHTDAAMVLAKKFNLPVVITFLEKKDEKYIMSFVDSFYVDDIKEGVKRQVRVIEEQIKKDISKWYLFHNRFKKSE